MPVLYHHFKLQENVIGTDSISEAGELMWLNCHTKDQQAPPDLLNHVLNKSSEAVQRKAVHIGDHWTLLQHGCWSLSAAKPASQDTYGFRFF